ncbi:MAG: sigma-54-dependent Fis family transcriptional regulator [Desulfobacteraceae bacterium]|nr:MAG: sigma-54-dependent Fis family transcriptional regulator [Desulfobacteraceae bacterium]
MLHLTVEERGFFDLVGQAVLTNPFSDARAEIDDRIAGLYADDTAMESVDRVIELVERRVGLLEAGGRSDINRYNEQDRRLLTYAFLFEAFHRFSPRLDQLIAAQMAEGERSLPVPFAREMIGRLEGLGFAHAEAVRYFELGFQVRRAFFFIRQNLIGRSPCMRLLREKLWNNVFTHNIDWYDRFLWNRMEDFSTLILGPTGAGKGTAAGAIGRSAYIPFDERKGCFVTSFTGSFTPLNLSQFSETLIESELFGHRKGAFTGAREDYRGVFSRCSPYGAIFLDEIGEVSQPIQIKLLQVLQERRFTPVGSHEVQRFSGRIIAATNRPLAELRSRRILRDDFYYRLCSDIIAIPSLAQRIGEDPAELDELLDHTVGHILGRPSRELTDMLRNIIIRRLGLAYPWPGNVRELEQCVRRILLYRAYDPEYRAQPAEPEARMLADMLEGNLDAQGLMAAYCHALYRRLGTIEAVARRVSLDRRTVKKHIEAGRARAG